MVWVSLLFQTFVRIDLGLLFAGIAKTVAMQVPKDQNNIEIQNGRAAMLGVTGDMMHQSSYLLNVSHNAVEDMIDMEIRTRNAMEMAMVALLETASEEYK